MPQRYVLAEVSLSRIWQYIEDPSKSFGVLSAFRHKLSKAENIERHHRMIAAVRGMGLGHIEMRGGYTGESGFVNELSLFIPNIPRRSLLAIGQRFEQESVIYRDSTSFALLDTDSGSVMTNFRFGSGRDNLVLAQEVMKDFFSALLKSGHAGRQFQFQAESFRLEERVHWGFFRHVYGPKGEQPWTTIYEEFKD